MTGAWPSPEAWLLHAALGGALVLGLTWWLVRRTAGPSRQQRLAEWGLGAALLTALLSAGPSWLSLPLPLPAAERPATAPDPATAEVAAPPEVALLSPALPEADESPEVLPSESLAPPPRWEWPDAQSTLALVGRGVVIAYGGVAAVLLLRWLFAGLALARLVATAEEPPEPAARLFESLTQGGPPARLRVAPGLRVPVSCGLLRPTVLIPPGLSDVKELRWVFLHELTHLRRRDPWTCVLLALGEVVFFYLPWFWVLRRQVRLCQEYLADAAVAEGETHPEDYAEFLLSLTPAPVPVGAASMSGSSSDLFRRVSRMLTERTSNVESRRPWGWKAVLGGLLAVAVLASGVGLSVSRTVADEPKKEPAKKDEKKPEKKDEKKPKDRDVADPFAGLGPNLDEVLRKLGEGDEEGMREFQKELHDQLARMRQRLVGNPRFPGLMPLPPLPGAPFGEPMVQGQGRLGVGVEKPSATLAEQLELPKDQGLVLRQVVADSAADKAGLKEHDILLEVAGKSVPSDPAWLVKMIGGMKADEKFDVVVLRKGRRETVKGVTLPELKTAKKPVAKTSDNGLAGRNNAASTALTRNGDEFTIKHREGNVTFNVTGTVDDGKAKLGAVTLTEGDSSKDYDSLDKVPAAHRGQVQKLLEMAGKGNVKAEIRN